MKVPPTDEEKEKANTKGWSNPRRSFSKKGMPTMTYEYNMSKKWWDKIAANTGATPAVKPTIVLNDILDLSDMEAVAKAFMTKFSCASDSEGVKQLRHQKALLGLRDLFENLRD